jgi:predicted nuclease of restriction endonuclease-like (RecB) superfamily
MVEAYWQIGKRIVEQEQEGSERAKYGEAILKELSINLTHDFGKGFSEPNLRNFRQFFLTYPDFQICYTLCSVLSWSHNRLIMRVENEEARKFYLTEAKNHSWSVRTLERNINTQYYQRLLSTNQVTNKEQESIHYYIKDPYIFEFLNIQEPKDSSELVIEQGLIDNLQKFLMELGKGFSFVGRQFRISTELEHYYIDLVFYNYLLKCFVLFDLKIGNLKDKLVKYSELQDKIKENEKIETLLLKAGIRIEELERDKTLKNTSINNNTYQITSLEEKIKNNLSMIIKIQEESEKEKLYKIYLEAFGKNGISKIIMKTMMPLINSELQRLMEDSSYFKLEVRISDKNEVEFMMIDNGTGVEKLMVSGSGYEKTIASLALRSVLSKICSLPKPNIIVFDEVFGKISNDNLEMVSEFFVKIKEYFEKIFVITHNPMVNQWADTVVKIRKEDNISQVYQ